MGAGTPSGEAEAPGPLRGTGSLCGRPGRVRGLSLGGPCREGQGPCREREAGRPPVSSPVTETNQSVLCRVVRTLSHTPAAGGGRGLPGPVGHCPPRALPAVRCRLPTAPGLAPGPCRPSPTTSPDGPAVRTPVTASRCPSRQQTAGPCRSWDLVGSEVSPGGLARLRDRHPCVSAECGRRAGPSRASAPSLSAVWPSSEVTASGMGPCRDPSLVPV